MATPTKRVNKTALRRKKIDLLTRFMDGFGISAKQVVVLPHSARKKKAVYCKQSEVIINRFFQIYKNRYRVKPSCFMTGPNFLTLFAARSLMRDYLGRMWSILQPSINIFLPMITLCMEQQRQRGEILYTMRESMSLTWNPPFVCCLSLAVSSLRLLKVDSRKTSS